MTPGPALLAVAEPDVEDLALQHFANLGEGNTAGFSNSPPRDHRLERPSPRPRPHGETRIVKLVSTIFADDLHAGPGR